MKRLLLGFLLCITMTTTALAANPVVTLDKAVYMDDNMLADLSAIVPYREVEFQYNITADTSAITYEYFILSESQATSAKGSVAGTISPFKIKAKFSSLETGKISLFVRDSDGHVGMSENQIKAIAGTPPVVHVKGIKLRDMGNPLGEPTSHLEMTLPNTLTSNKLEAVVEPENATNKKVKWSSNNEKVATVDSNGVVNGIVSGDATITATTEDGGFKATCKVTVRKDGAVAIAIAPAELSLLVGDVADVYVESSALAFYQAISWDVENPEIASITPSSTADYRCDVKGLEAGETRLIATTDGPDGKKISATCKITVKNLDLTPPPPGGHVPDPQLPDQGKNSNGSSSGCNAGLAGLLTLALIPAVRRRK